MSLHGGGLVAKSCLILVTPWTVAHQAPLPIEFPRQEYWSGLLFPPPGDLPDPGIEPMSLTSPTLAGRFFTTSAMWEAPLQLAYSNSKAEAECVSNICLKSSDWTPFLLLCP